MNLKEIVTSALGEAEGKLKIASAADAPAPAAKTDFLPKTASAAKPEIEVKSKTASGSLKEDVLYLLKLAQALDEAGPIVTKLATDLPKFESGHMEPTKHTKTSPASVPHEEAASGGAPKTEGGTQAKTFKSPHAGTSDKTAALRVLTTKLAQAEMMSKQGQTDAAAKYASEAKAEYAKVAEPKEDEKEEKPETAAKTEAKEEEKKSVLLTPVKLAAGAPSLPSTPVAPKADLGGGKSGITLSTVPGDAPHVPDNDKARSITKREAKTKFVKTDAAKHLAEPAFSAAHDKGVTDNLDEGLNTSKISSAGAAAARVLLQKLAAKADDPHASEEERDKARKLKDKISHKAGEKKEKDASDLLSA